MRVRLLKELIFVDIRVGPGSVVNVNEQLGRRMLKEGRAVADDDGPAVIETAAVTTPRRGKKRAGTAKKNSRDG
jgi:hypothetical protein